MSQDNQRPKKYDLVLGGNNPPPVSGLVLGGIEGVKHRFAKANTDREKIMILLRDALTYNHEKEEWLLELLAIEHQKVVDSETPKYIESKDKIEFELAYNKSGELLWQIFSLIWEQIHKLRKQKLESYLKYKKRLEIYLPTLLKANPQLWNNWRKRYTRHIILNLSNCELSRTNLSSAFLRKVNLSGAILSHCNLHKADLSNANLTDTNLSSANLIEADLSGANLKNSNLNCANLQYANLEDANLENANFSNANLQCANLFCYNFFDKTDLNRRSFMSGDFDYVYAQRVYLSSSYFKNTNFTNANIRATLLDLDSFRIYCRECFIVYEPGWE